jgi:gliding motility-associated-like protein
MLVATNNNPGCADTAYKQVYAYPKLAPDFITPLPLCLDGNSLNFTAAGIYDTLAATFEWNFGNGATPSVSFVKNPTSIVFNTDGIKTVLLTVSQFGCTKTISKTITIYPEPRPQIIPGTTQCSGDTVTVQITYGSNSTITNTQINQGIPIPNYQNLGGGLYQFVYPDTGIYNLSVIAQNNFGCIDTTTQPIKAYPSFTPYFIPPDKQCIKNNSFNFTVQGTYQNLATFTWFFNSNANINTYYGNSVNNVSFSSPGYQTVILTGKQYSCIASDTQQVYVVPEALASIKPQDKFCEGLSYQFTNLSQSANSWYWNFGVLNTTNDTSTLKNPTFQFPDTGTYLVTLVAINDNSCFDTTILPISIKPLVKPYFPPPGNQCLDDNNFNLQASGYNSNQALFGWDFPAQANYDTALTSTISGLTFNTVGAYPITLYINEYGCLKSYTDTAFVFEPPKARIELINISGCLPVTVSFKDSSYSTTQYSHWWDFGDGNTNTEANPTHTYNTPGTYTVSLIIKNHSGCTRADTFSLKNAISVYPLPKSGLVLDSTERSVFEPVIQFTDVSSNADHCILFFGDGQSSSNCNSTHWYPDSGWYQYTQIVTNKYGCSDTLIGKIYIRPEFIIYIPNAFTPNNDKLNAFFKPVIWGIKSYEFWVFDRWGLELFYTQDINTGWDGTYKGKEAPIDVYVYKVRYINVFNKSGELNGTFTLIR